MKSLFQATLSVATGIMGAALLAFAATSAQPAKVTAVGVVLDEGGDSLAIIDPVDGRVLAIPDVGGRCISRTSPSSMRKAAASTSATREPTSPSST